jgi:hypothetical protein
LPEEYFTFIYLADIIFAAIFKRNLLEGVIPEKNAKILFFNPGIT